MADGNWSSDWLEVSRRNIEKWHTHNAVAHGLVRDARYFCYGLSVPDDPNRLNRFYKPELHFWFGSHAIKKWPSMVQATGEYAQPEPWSTRIYSTMWYSPKTNIIIPQFITNPFNDRFDREWRTFLWHSSLPLCHHLLTINHVLMTQYTLIRLCNRLMFSFSLVQHRYAERIVSLRLSLTSL